MADSNPQFHAGPIQLIKINEDGKCEVNDYAKNLLSQIKTKIGVIAVAGLYRTGKSFLMNRLLGINSGFDIGPSVNPCTKGIWMWGQPVNLSPDLHIIIIDTEGLGSSVRSTNIDMQIFTLGILLSSLFVYNSMGPINEDSIDNLSLVLQLSELLQSKTSSSDQLSGSLHFPPLIWVLRDFNLRLVNEAGESISPSTYLESCLESGPNPDDHKNKIRKTIRDRFSQRTCLTLPRPVENEADLRNLKDIPYEGLRGKFRNAIEGFVESAYRQVKPLVIKGNSLNGQMFNVLMESYITALNNSTIPTINNTWANIVQNTLRISGKDAVYYYRTAMSEEGLKALPMSSSSLRKLHSQIRKCAVDVFNQNKIDMYDPKYIEAKSALKTKFLDLFSHVETENGVLSNRKITDVTSNLINTYITKNKVVLQDKPDLVVQNWSSVISILLATCQDSVDEATLSKGIVDVVCNKMCKSLMNVISDLKSALDTEKSNLLQKIAATEGKNEAAMEVFESEKNEFADELSSERRKWTDQVLKLETELEETKNAYEDLQFKYNRETAQIKDIETSFREQIKSLQERLQDRSTAAGSGSGSSKKISLNSNEVDSLRDAVYSALSEIKSIDAQKRSLELKSEHERQLITLERKFNRQLSEARKKNETLIDNLRITYDEEVDQLRSTRSDLLLKIKDGEKENLKLQNKIDLLENQLSHFESEKSLVDAHSSILTKQSDVIMRFLRQLNIKDVSSANPINSNILEELTLLTAESSAHQ